MHTENVLIMSGHSLFWMNNYKARMLKIVPLLTLTLADGLELQASFDWSASLRDFSTFYNLCVCIKISSVSETRPNRSFSV